MYVSCAQPNCQVASLVPLLLLVGIVMMLTICMMAVVFLKLSAGQSLGIM